MTFAELFAEVGQVLPKGSYSIEVTAWCHRHEGADSTSLDWSIWDAATQEHHEGKTPELALARLKRQRLPDESAPLQTVVIP